MLLVEQPTASGGRPVRSFTPSSEPLNLRRRTFAHLLGELSHIFGHMMEVPRRFHVMEGKETAHLAMYLGLCIFICIALVLHKDLLCV